MMAIVSSIFIGFVLYHTVEKQFLNSSKTDTIFKRPNKLLFLSISGLIFGCQVAVMKSRYLPVGPTARTLRNKKLGSIIENTWILAGSRSEEIRPRCRSIGRHSNLRNFVECNPPSRSEIVLLGDSHALDLWYTLNSTFPHSTTIEIAGTGCGLDLEHEKGMGCNAILTEYPEHLQKRIDRVKAVVMVSNWHELTLDKLKSSLLNAAINYFKANSTATIFVMGPRPHFEPHPREVFEQDKSPEIESRVIKTNKFMKFEQTSAKHLYQFTQQKNVTYVSIPKIMCNATHIGQASNEFYCPTLSEDGTAFIYVDKTHYNKKGASKLISSLKQKISVLL